MQPDVQDRIATAMAAGANASGIPWEPFTDEQQDDIDLWAEAMDSVVGVEINDLSNHPIVSAIAAERFGRYIDTCRERGERLLDTRIAPSYDESDPITATRLYLLTHDSDDLVALQIPPDWKTYARLALRAKTECEAHVVHSCYDHQSEPATEILAYKRGEFVYVFKICPRCLHALKDINCDDFPYYSGPFGWHDDVDARGTGLELGDPWSDDDASEAVSNGTAFPDLDDPWADDESLKDKPEAAPPPPLPDLDDPWGHKEIWDS
jgi:hypothetical protein